MGEWPAQVGAAARVHARAPGEDQGSGGGSGLQVGSGLRGRIRAPGGVSAPDPEGSPHSRTLAYPWVLQSREVALEAVDCAQIRVPSRENRDVYTEHSYPNGHVIIKRLEAAG